MVLGDPRCCCVAVTCRKRDSCGASMELTSWEERAWGRWVECATLSHHGHDRFALGYGPGFDSVVLPAELSFQTIQPATALRRSGLPLPLQMN